MEKSTNFTSPYSKASVAYKEMCDVLLHILSRKENLKIHVPST